LEDTPLGSFHLTGLPRRRGQKAAIEVTFSYDLNGILHVLARAIGNNRESGVSIDVNNQMNPARRPVVLAEWENAPEAKKYRPLIRKVMKTLEEYMDTETFSEQHLYDVLFLADELKAALILGDTQTAETNKEKLESFLEKWEKFEARSSRLEDALEDMDPEQLFDLLSRMGKGRKG
jgi:molecular chaperone DnaK